MANFCIALPRKKWEINACTRPWQTLWSQLLTSSAFSQQSFQAIRFVIYTKTTLKILCVPWERIVSHCKIYVLTRRTALFFRWRMTHPWMPFYLIYASGLQLPQLTSLPIILKPRTRQAKSESSIWLMVVWQQIIQYVHHLSSAL